MNKFRIVASILLLAIIGLIWAAFSGEQPQEVKPAQEEQSGGYSGLGK